MNSFFFLYPWFVWNDRRTDRQTKGCQINVYVESAKKDGALSFLPTMDAIKWESDNNRKVVKLEKDDTMGLNPITQACLCVARSLTKLIPLYTTNRYTRMEEQEHPSLSEQSQVKRRTQSHCHHIPQLTQRRLTTWKQTAS